MIAAFPLTTGMRVSNKKDSKQVGGLPERPGQKDGLDLVDIDVLVVVASVAVFVEFDVVVDAFVTVAVGRRE